MSTLNSEIDRVVEYFKANPDETRVKTDRIEDYAKGRDVDGYFTRLRMDLELADDANVDKVSPWLVFRELGSKDLSDLLENGDSHSDDALYKSMDGSRKRGKTLTNVELPEIVIYGEHKAGKKSTEYAIFLILYAEFE